LDQQELQRRAEALQAIYRAKGEELSEIDSKALAQHLGTKPARAAIICAVLIVGLAAFLAWRFLI
jgi:hypothetical protein